MPKPEEGYFFLEYLKSLDDGFYLNHSALLHLFTNQHDFRNDLSMVEDFSLYYTRDTAQYSSTKSNLKQLANNYKLASLPLDILQKVQSQGEYALALFLSATCKIANVHRTVKGEYKVNHLQS